MSRWIALLLVISTQVLGSEVDQFTGRYIPLEDSFEVVSDETERLFDEALTRANKRKSCNEKRLYKSLRKYFRNHIMGKEFVQFVMHHKSVSKRPTVLKDSIYGLFTIWEAYTIGLARIYKDTAGSILRMGDVRLGSDKFEHFFGRGYIYFRKYYKKKKYKSLEGLLRYGHFTERQLLGSRTTGVYSYGDLAGNLTGMRFWNHLLQKNDDILGAEYNWGPYVKCEDGKWVKNKGDRKYTIDWKRYIDYDWDEGNNCAKIRTPKMLKKVLGRISALEKNDAEGRSYQCPFNPEKIKAAHDKWGKIGPWVVNLGGHQVVKNADGTENFFFEKKKKTGNFTDPISQAFQGFDGVL